MKNPKSYRSAQRPRVSRYAALAAAALLFGVASPAVAQEMSGQPPEHTAEADPEKIVASVEVSGWPDGEVLRAGEQFTVTMRVDSGLLDAPSLAGALVGLTYGDESIAFAELDEAGTAELTVRPLVLGELELVPYMAESEAYASVTGEPHVIDVDVVPVSVDLSFDTSHESPTAYGGGEQTIFVSVESDCAVMAQSEDEREMCAATFGEPAGRLTLTRGEQVLEQVEVVGSWSDTDFLQPGESLSIGDEAENQFVFSVQVPNILLGTSNVLDYEATFEPYNWFDGSSEGSESELRAAPTSVEVFVGDDLLEPQHLVYADEVSLFAFVNADSGAAPLSGTVQFFANGEPLSGAVPLEDQVGAEFEWKPAGGSGEYAITAVFTPETMNHEASESDAYPLTVVVTPAPNPTPGKPTPAPTPNEPTANEPTSKQQTGQLANTGTESSLVLAIAGLALAGAGAAALLLRRRGA